MRILLIEPAKAPISIGGEDVFIFEPLALEYIAAGVARDHEVMILDLRLEKDLQKVLSTFRPDIVGITAYTVHVNGVRKLFEAVKKWNAKVLTVVGGHHATVAPDDFNYGDIDLIVAGEGVFVFKEIVRRFEEGKAFEGIPGVAVPGKDRLERTDAPALVDLDAFPFPERRLTAK